MTEPHGAPSREVEFHHGSGAAMGSVMAGSAALVLTGPPYFSAVTEELLQAPRREQTRLEEVRAQVVEFALGLRGVFREAFRVTRPGGVLVIQTKNLRYGEALVPLASIHGELAESVGFRMVSRVFWRRTHDSVRHMNPSRLRRRATEGRFQAVDVEDFLIFRKPGGDSALPPDLDSFSESELDEMLSPLWVLPGPGSGGHPHAAPSTVLARFVALFTREGDLVVDPFAGRGTTLAVARALGRRAVGHEIDRTHVLAGRRRLVEGATHG